MPDFGIAEGLAGLGALFGFDALGALGIGGAEAGIGAGVGAGELGALGTADAFMGAGAFDALAGGAGAGTGASALGTAGSFLGAADASALGGGAALAGGLGEGALGLGAGINGADVAADVAAGSGLASGTDAIAGVNTPITALLEATPTAGFGTQSVSGLSPNVANANASANPFDVGTKSVTGFGAAGQPAGTGASAVSAPGGVSAVADPTATVAGAQGATSIGGAPLNPAPGGAGGSISDLIGKTGAGAVKSLTDNPLGVGLGAAGLGYNILQGQKQTENQKALAADAKTATANSTSLVNQGQALQQYLTTGKLPDAYETQVNNAINDAKTRAIANAAAQGQPTDPTKNSSLAATLAGIDNQRPAMVSSIAEKLASSGANLINAGQSAAGLSGQLYQALVANDTAAAKNTGAAIASLAAALNGRTSTKIGDTNINVSKAA